MSLGIDILCPECFRPIEMCRCLPKVASAGNPVGPRSDVYDRARLSCQGRATEGSESEAVPCTWRSEGSRLTSADSMGPARATRGYTIYPLPYIDCGQCGRPVWECACDFGV